MSHIQSAIDLQCIVNQAKAKYISKEYPLSFIPSREGYTVSSKKSYPLKLFGGRHHFWYCDIMGPIRSGHGRLEEPGVIVNPGMAQEKRGPPSVSRYQTKSNSCLKMSENYNNFVD